MIARGLRAATLGAFVLACAACAPIAPLVEPTLPHTPTAFKEATGPWVDAGTHIPSVSEAWWRAYGDAELDDLQQRLLDASPDLAAALARYQQTRATVDALRAERLPTVGVSADMQRLRQSERRPLRVLGPNSPDEYGSATLGLALSYEPDLWGRVRRRIEAGEAEKSAARADLAAARLALQAQLADTLLTLRAQDAEIALLREAEASYLRAAELVDHRHAGGLASGLDLAQAQNQLESTRSQLRQASARRALLEHSVAALVGESASGFSIAPQFVVATLPVVPPGMPSTLLQRRPDIAAAQQRIVAAHAGLGVARTAFFPSVTLGAQAGLQSSDLARFIEAPNLFWAFGPALAATLFDGGRRAAGVARAESQVEEAGQRYRAVVLAAFQQVEDQLALLGNYGDAAADERAALAAAQRALDIANHRYRDGAASYLDVTTAQSAQLAARRSVLELETRQQRATVQLVKTLGGGWSDGG